MSQAVACGNNDCDQMAEELLKHTSDGKTRGYCHNCAKGLIARGAATKIGDL